MECRHCHNIVPCDAIYCHVCGKRLAAQSKRHRRHRPQSQGSIVKLTGSRKNPYWARLPVDYSSGVPIRESLGCFPTYADAAEALCKALYAPELLPKEKKLVTLKDIYESFVNSHYFEGLSNSGRASHVNAWKHLAICGDIPITEVTKSTFQCRVDALREDGAKRETLAKIRNLASKICAEAMGMGLMSVNYGQLVQLPRADAKPAAPFSSGQIRCIWEAADSGDKDAMTVLVLIYTGMRPGELLTVDIAQHLHIDGDYWYIQHGSKTQAGINRIIPLPKIVHKIILHLVDDRCEGPLIAAEKGGFWRLDNWRPRRYNALMDRLGFTGYTPYSCRHSYADLQKRRHISPEIMMEVMGHKDYSTTVEKYQTTTDEDIARICTEVDGFVRPF